jgi:hypothetical protein
MITPPMEPFCACERVKGMVLGTLAGEFSFVPRILGGNSRIVEKCRLSTTQRMPAP